MKTAKSECILYRRENYIAILTITVIFFNITDEHLRYSFSLCLHRVLLNVITFLVHDMWNRHQHLLFISGIISSIANTIICMMKIGCTQNKPPQKRDSSKRVFWIYAKTIWLFVTYNMYFDATCCYNCLFNLFLQIKDSQMISKD